MPMQEQRVGGCRTVALPILNLGARRGWLGLGVGYGQVRKISPSPGFESRSVQPVASHYTDRPYIILYYTNVLYRPVHKLYYTNVLCRPVHKLYYTNVLCRPVHKLSLLAEDPLETAALFPDKECDV